MKNKLLILFISSLFIVANGHQLNFFETIGYSELVKHIVESDDHNNSPIDINNTSYYEISMDMSDGNPDQGLEIFQKKLEKYCDISAVLFASIHTQSEWEEFVEAGSLYEELIHLCPKAESIFNPQWLPNLYQFFYEYASDSGNIPISNH